MRFPKSPNKTTIKGKAPEGTIVSVCRFHEFVASATPVLSVCRAYSVLHQIMDILLHDVVPFSAAFGLALVTYITPWEVNIIALLATPFPTVASTHLSASLQGVSMTVVAIGGVNDSRSHRGCQ